MLQDAWVTEGPMPGVATRVHASLTPPLCPVFVNSARWMLSWALFDALSGMKR